MKDFRFLFNRYVRGIKKLDGYSWSFPERNMLIDHQEDFLNDVILDRRETMIDIGANVGAWTIRASPYYQRIYSFEPNHSCFKALERNVKLNRCINVTIYNLALDIDSGMTDQAVMFPVETGGAMFRSKVRTETIDRMMFREASIIKIDAEGAGRRIIEGGFKTIQRDHPVIVEEVHTQSEASITKILPEYSWEKRYRDSDVGDWLYREEGKQVFLIGEYRN